MTSYGEDIRVDPMSDASVRELYSSLVNTIVDHSERRHGHNEADMDEYEAMVFFAEVVVASGAIIADLLSKEDDRCRRRANIRSFQKLLTRMVEEKADLMQSGGHA